MSTEPLGFRYNYPRLPGRALCAQTDPDVFFPEQGGPVAAPKSVCRRCEVQAACLQWALDNDEREGVWGGLSAKERRELRKGRAA